MDGRGCSPEASLVIAFSVLQLSACDGAGHIDAGCGAVAEYRLDDLARLSGVSARNIRAYRERGLLDRPRRRGRAAFYDDYHLSQLATINELLNKGFTSAHIAEFFARMREGHDLAPILGLDRAISTWRPDGAGADPVAVDVDPASQEARRLVSTGLAELRGDSVVLVDPRLAQIVARAADPLHYINMLLTVLDATDGTVETLAATLAATFDQSIAARYGSDRALGGDQLARLIGDYRELGGVAVAHQLDNALRAHQRRLFDR